MTVGNVLDIKDLPPPLEGKAGWPWTEQSPKLPEKRPDGSDWPRVSIVTPSYNQDQFLEEAIRSVLLQGYPNLEYIIIDGGSTDNSTEIVKKYSPWLSYWVSEPDRGQSHAINKGFERCTGDYIAWMNSSDCYLPKALSLFAGSNVAIADFIFGWKAYSGFSLEEATISYSTGVRDLKLKSLLRFFYSTDYIIPSQSVFIARGFAEKIGFLQEDLHYCMDLDWYARIALAKPTVYNHEEPICFYRFHDDAKTRRAGIAVKIEAIKIAQEYAAFLSPNERRELHSLIAYSNRLEELSLKPRETLLGDLLKAVIDFPVQGLRDRRFLGLIKRALAQRIVPSFR
ncbi:glycosyltransferase family 2 protein [Leptolyngbya sp. FACHB-261]|uniref:glycosyltransferase family 2 protein n=1 Tax=Leptolyngbya sp. FACHB-261 TaxID=2692806 RepID=UPI001682AD23|nr:glycosyltransferase family 2 protein [Leptolyngbya sp. FACHB-261]MBD2099626.1 glycosyltransferase [Leptolyngbya sp. FACHB-261]